MIANAREPNRRPVAMPSEPHGPATPELAVVIPVFKQPGLLAEAVESVLSQRSERRIGCVIVDDGCPFPETGATAAMFAALHPGRIVHLRQSNRGLSGARNRGIEFVLRAWPDCRAAYFLDADNRLHPDCLERMWRQLEQAPPEVGWVYPDIDMFGFTEHYDMSGGFLPLLLLRQNYCEAGSMVRRSLLDTGVRFDESMKLGFEDWDFWLQALGRGFRGEHARGCGFRYRRRAESMLLEAERSRPVILHYMKRKHRDLLLPRAVLRREHVELPRYAFFAADSPEAALATDFGAPERRCLAKEEARAEIVRNVASHGRVAFPDFLVFGSILALDRLQRHGLLHGILWQAERLLERVNFVGVTLEESEPDLRVVSAQDADGAVERFRSSALVVMTRMLLEKVMGDPADAWIRSLMAEAQPTVAVIGARLPQAGANDAVPPRAVGHLLAEIGALRELWQRRPHQDVRWGGKRWRPLPHRIARDLAESGPLYPYVARGQREQIAFLLPTAGLGGVERVVMNYALTCRERGFGTHLVVTEADEALLPAPFDDAFDSVAFVGDAATAGWQQERSYFGAHPSAWALRGDHRDLLGLLAGMDVVFNTHSVDAHAVMNELRRRGVRTVLGLHQVEQDRYGRPMGNSHLALAYEHAYDHFAVISRELEAWCLGQGVPPSKLLRIENAPAYPTDPATVERALAEKAERGDEPLRILYLGRFDPQKGLDRLDEIICRSCAGAEAVDWRVVGKEVLAQDRVACPAVSALREPAAVSSRELDRLYAWADLVVMPSRFEGVPLTILEAQRLGCVVVATAVGAVEECIEDGIDGLLVAERDDESVVADFCRLIAELSADRDRLARLRSGAARRAAGRSWQSHLAPFFTAIGRSQSAAGRFSTRASGAARC